MNTFRVFISLLWISCRITGRNQFCFLFVCFLHLSHVQTANKVEYEMLWFWFLLCLLLLLLKPYYLYIHVNAAPELGLVSAVFSTTPWLDVNIWANKGFDWSTPMANVPFTQCCSTLFQTHYSNSLVVLQVTLRHHRSPKLSHTLL